MTYINRGLDSLIIGVDIGSTTVKATVVDPESKQIIWSDYQRHHTKQAEKVLDLLVAIGNEFPDVKQENIRVFTTGSGSGPIAPHIGAKFVQEVNSVTMAVEHLHPDVGSVIELGGQDAKIIIFKENAETGNKQALTSMNDKCASGTGATIDKCMIKVGMPAEEVGKLHFDDSKLHHVAAKCGVFAETDIVNLVKSGIPSAEIMCSLADAIVMQNLSVLTRGNTLRHRVLLLGGPNTYLPFLQECWRMRIPQTWKERGYEYPNDVPIDSLIFVPDNSQYYAAYGAVLYGLHEPADVGVYMGLEKLKEFIAHGRKAKLGEKAGPPLVGTKTELEQFRQSYRIPEFIPATFTPRQKVRAVIGLDGGSTSSKAVLVDEQGDILLKEYQLSKGNPLEDTKEMLKRIRETVKGQGADLEIIGFGATGYAADVLEKTLHADVNIVETVAHMMSAVHQFGDIDVICDIGGQDIKVLFLKNRDIRNFKLSNQCSAGNGMLLQAMADQFGIPVQEYANTAFNADLSPKFSYGCAVFLDADRVNFQKEGYSKEELLAGLALVLPKNVWQYVVQIPRMAELGRKFVLQGGTQYNLAAVKAQVDYIEQRVPDAEVYVHPHPGEAGAIGAAMETLRVVKRRGYSSFLGLDTAIDLRYVSRNDESTRCNFCPNHCSRTFIDSETPDGNTARYISGFSCEKGTVEDQEAVLKLTKQRQELKKHYPNLVEYEARRMFQHFYDAEPLPEPGLQVDDVRVKRGLFGFGMRKIPNRRPFERSSVESMNRRNRIRIGIPRVLNIWSTAPFWRTYFETLGIDKRNIVFSDNTSEEMWQEGGKYGSIDPCYPSKVAQAHVHNLLFKHHESKPLDYIFFPCITHIPTHLHNVMDSASCPIVAGAPNVIKAAFTKEVNFFETKEISYLDPAVTFTEPNMLKKQLFEAFADQLQITEDESDFAAEQGWNAMDRFDAEMQEKGRAILEQIEQENRLAILMIGRPYHSDPGMNHGVLEEFQVLGYPILSMRSIPKDEAWLQRFFSEDLKSGRVEYSLEVSDVWPENFSSNSVQKVWAAKFAARHPNVAVLDLSSFKCGHDAPTYGLIESIISTADTPYSALHDIDANKPSGSIKIRVKTYAHSLGLHEERLQDLARKKAELQQRLEQKRAELTGRKPGEQAEVI
ncbi:BadF/BadG/BcrA/BcrD ATPase family protein [Paenibacillus apiarius]|uniref:Acyl-CoA dehydratase activase-related protein n=1 Tax=Paenibacillus apiarius TaxID=46240 RepID=A0ABT4DZL5_9BACL|nr:BadF/BadG/BcrA/BcrD ATPase family protein [Paenibacillus apiarius]MCY9517403.1 acyl-CoA dehydratase activase-related protein [Paenibacillus apiarius]MCY9522797.1 acyl-CoA dehydratase activase-related protein [Paenibacillus apiarius]MCY9552182.1 acyl-CoA dehydratase activase-related protein [Paenibacillus apiarius]MCY9561178.1 acyl-CoA dehydratase activase-related protein [Paenibacillus apiarius]MCY9682202.1 acyl-CoA dehydratase activase-related protein [Paenibacillus apiarius]